MGPQKLRKYIELFANKLAINEKRVLYSILNSEEKLNDLKAYLQDYFEGDLKNKRIENLKSLIKNKKNFSERLRKCFSLKNVGSRPPKPRIDPNKVIISKGSLGSTFDYSLYKDKSTNKYYIDLTNQYGIWYTNLGPFTSESRAKQCLKDSYGADQRCIDDVARIYNVGPLIVDNDAFPPDYNNFSEDKKINKSEWKIICDNDKGKHEEHNLKINDINKGLQSLFGKDYFPDLDETPSRTNIKEYIVYKILNLQDDFKRLVRKFDDGDKAYKQLLNDHGIKIKIIPTKDSDGKIIKS